MPMFVVALVFAGMFGYAAERTVSIEVANSGHILIPVTFDDGSKAKFLLDTGSATTVLDRTFARQRGLPTQKAGEMVGAGTGSIVAEVTPSLTVQMLDAHAGAQFVFHDRDITVIPLREVLGPLDKDLVGILGGSFLSQYVVTLDKKKGSMTITPPSRFRAPAGKLGLPLQVIGGFPVLSGAFRADHDDPRVEGNLLLDLGANHGLAVHWPTVQKYKLIDPGDADQKDLSGGMGITGATAANRLAPCAELQIGPLVRKNTQIELATGPGGAPEIPHLIGFVGTELFKGTLILDYPHKRLWVE